MAGLTIGSLTGGDSPERGGPRTKAAPPAPRKPALELEQLVGQVLMSSFDGPEVPDYLSRRLRAGETAGVILFGRNATSAPQLGALTRRLQDDAGGGALVATDQEGGEIRSVPFAGPPAAQPAQGPPGAVRRASRAAGEELRGLGVNVNLAPVADVPAATGSVMSGRAFAARPPAAADRVRAAVEGYRSARVAPTAKHFPGIGAATANTDDAPVTIDEGREVLEQRELVPFRAALAARVPLVMSSHAVYPALDPSRPASQSQPILGELLRGRLGFRGVVVTDSIEAAAVLRRSGVGAAAERSIAGGSDLVLMTGSGSWKLVYPRLLARARRDPAFRARIGRAAARVLALKRALGLKVPRPSPR